MPVEGGAEVNSATWIGNEMKGGGVQRTRYSSSDTVLIFLRHRQ